MQYFVANVSPDKAQPQTERGRLHYTDRKDKIDSYFTDQGLAVREAQSQAKENPTQQFAVLGVIAVYETTDPKVIVKEYNDAGELVLVKS